MFQSTRFRAVNKSTLNLSMQESPLIPSNDFPSIEWKGRSPTNWMWDFEREGYAASGGHPLYSETDIEYRFNTYGYRSAEFGEFSGIRILSIGCSYAFGYALPQHEIFSEVFTKRIESETKKAVIHWNLGLGGASNDYISRTLCLVIPRLNPDIVLVNLTWPARREYVAATGEPYHYLPSVEPAWNPALKECYQHFSRLASRPDDQLNIFRNYKAIETLLLSRYWLFSAVSETVPRHIEHHADWSRFVGGFRELRKPEDLARDNHHPGRNVHKEIADRYFVKVQELGWIDSLLRR